MSLSQNNIDELKRQLMETGVPQEIMSNPQVGDFFRNVAGNPEFAKVFAEFYKQFIEHHKKKLIESADGEVDQAFNGHLNVLKQVLSPIDYSDVYVKYQEEEQKFAVDDLKHNQNHFQNLIDEEQELIEKIKEKNLDYAKTPKFLELIENQVEVIDYISSNNMQFEATEKPKSGKRKFAFEWSETRKKRDLILLIALLTEEIDSEELEAMRDHIALQGRFKLAVGGVARAVLENYKEIAKTGTSPKTYSQIAQEWAGYKTKDTEKDNIPPTDISYSEVLIANIINVRGLSI